MTGISKDKNDICFSSKKLKDLLIKTLISLNSLYFLGSLIRTPIHQIDFCIT